MCFNKWLHQLAKNKWFKRSAIKCFKQHFNTQFLCLTGFCSIIEPLWMFWTSAITRKDPCDILQPRWGGGTNSEWQQVFNPHMTRTKRCLVSAGDSGGQGGAAADRKADVLHSFSTVVSGEGRDLVTYCDLSSVQSPGPTEVRLRSNWHICFRRATG